MHKSIIIMAIAILALPLFNACEKSQEIKKEPSISQEIYRKLRVGRSTPIKGENLDGIEWSASPYFVADVNESNRIVPKHVGLSFIYGVNNGMFDSDFRVVAEVTPFYTDYDLPSFCTTNEYEGITYDDIPLFGMVGKSQIKQSEKRRLDSRSTNTLLVYKTNNEKSPYVTYLFNENGYLSICGSLIDPAHSSNLQDFIKERYEVFSFDLSKSTSYFVHRTHSKEDEIIDYIGGVQYNSQLGGFLLAFSPYDGTRTSLSESQWDEMAKEIITALNL